MRIPLAAPLLALVIVFPSLAAAPDSGAAWLTIDYASLVDRRTPTHSGEPLGRVIDRLAGRPRPAAGARESSDAADHALIDPLLESYAFVLPDAIDARAEGPPKALVEIGNLFPPGGAEPAWVELLRSRRYLIESDGRGALRAFVPWRTGEATSDGTRAPAADPLEVARSAWAEAWPVVRHPLAAERRRLGTPLSVEVYAYAHYPARTRFLLASRPLAVRVEETGPDGSRAPLDLTAWQRFLGQGLTLEGARLDGAGNITLFGSPSERPPTIVGRPLSLADAAVAYRAIFHGGADEPYMSLDRGDAPQTAVVNYGGRLKDTGLGMVSLLCDARFKTFSLGVDIVERQDVREEIRASVPGFRTHLERFAADPRSQGLSGQQTRLWFYPDTVELTLSAQGDLLAMRRARMAAASEKVALDLGEGTEPAAPWTTATVEEINRDYDALARLFPEMFELDQAVRWLSLFTWLRAADAAGLPVPELDALLAVELPASPTPRRFPQLLAFNAVPAAPGPGAVDVFERVDVVAALDRLSPPTGRPLPAAERFRRALAALDPRDPQHAALASELASIDSASRPDAELDAAAFRAERLRMHQLVLGTLPERERARLRGRIEKGDPPRVFSVGIGGLDLGMQSSLARAAGKSGALTGLGAAARALAPAERIDSPPPGEGSAATPRAGWRKDPPGLDGRALPAHASQGAESLAWPAAFDARYRMVARDGASGALEVVRVEEMRALRYRVDPGGGVAALAWRTAGPAAAAAPPDPFPADLLLLERVGEASTSSGAPAVLLRLSASGTAPVEAPFPRPVLERLVLGKEADLTPGRPLPGFSQLPPQFASRARTMVLLRPEEVNSPWVSGAPVYAGEESTEALAGALARWTAGSGGTVVAGVDPAVSPRRWAAAPTPRTGALLLPEGGFPPPASAVESALRAAWTSGPTVPSLPAPGAAGTVPELVVLVSSEGAAPLAERVLALAKDPSLKGRLLAVLSLAAPLRPDLAARLLGEGNLAGVGLVAWGGVGLPGAVDAIRALDGALAAARATPATPRRVEELAGPFTWFF